MASERISPPESRLLCGREKELARLAEIAAAAAAGRGSCLLIAGESGLGKSRLLREAAARLPMRLLTARCDTRTSTSYQPVAALMRQMLEGPGRLKRPAAVEPLLSGAPEAGPAADAADADGSHAPQLREAIVAFFRQAAANGPLALAIEDLQWADHATLDLLPILAEALRESPVLLLATYRAEEIPNRHPLRATRHELRRRDCLQEWRLEPLAAADSERLLAATLGGRPAPGLAELVHRRSRGLPLFVEETARALLASDALVATDAGLALREGEELPLPESIRDMIALQLAPLTENERLLLETAAAIGEVIEPELLLDLDGDETALERALELGFLEEAEDGRLAFRHALVREAIYRQIGWMRRRELNRRIAELLEARGYAPARVARHWLAGRRFDRARAALVRAAEAACKLDAWADAYAAGRQALEVWPEDEDPEARLATQERLAHCAQVCGRFQEALEILRSIASGSQLRADAARLARLHRAIASVHQMLNQPEQAVEAHRRAGEAFRQSGSLDDAACETLAAAGTLAGLVRLTEARREAQTACNLAAECGRPDVHARALALLGHIEGVIGLEDSAEQSIREALRIATENDLTHVTVEIHRRLGAVREGTAHFTQARDTYFSTLEQCRRIGAQEVVLDCLGCLAWALFRVGDWAHSSDVCRDVIRQREAPPYSRGAGIATLGLIHALRGEFRRARRLWQQLDSFTERRRLQLFALLRDGWWGMLADMGGERETAIELYCRFVHEWTGSEDRHDGLSALVWALPALAESGRAQEVAIVCNRLTTIANETANQEAFAVLAMAIAAQATLDGDHEAACRQLEHAIRLFLQLEVPLEEALARIERARALRRAGQSGTRSELEAAARLARQLGARPVLARIEPLLENTDGADHDPDDESAFCPEASLLKSLTPRQREIARLMAEGLTNKEMAARLHLSPRTVEMHVAGVLDRLNCRGRTEAVRRCAELSLLSPTGPD